MTETGEDGFPPRNAFAVSVEGKTVTEEYGREFYTKENGYRREQVSILKIVDGNGKAYEGKWKSQWSAIAPGIETRSPGTGVRYSYGEKSADEAIRIQRTACLVWVQFRSSTEIVDYDSPDVEGCSETYWRCYQAK